MPDLGTEPIDPALARKLDAFTVPSLPSGFAERLAQQAASLPPEAHSTAPLRTRRASPRRRWRVAATGLGAIALGMMSISAAAMGYLGEPVRAAIEKAPVVGPSIVRIIERVVPERLIVKQSPPAEAARVTGPKVVVPGSAASVSDDLAPELPSGAERRRILADPEARRAWLEVHPRAAQRIEARQAARRQFIETHPKAARILEERRAARESGATPQEMRQLRREQMREMRVRKVEPGSLPNVEARTLPSPAARIAEPPAEPSAHQSAVAPSAASLTGQGPDLAQRRLELRERRKERRERRRQRIEHMRP